MPPTLLSIPQKLRLRIFAEALTSSTGSLILRPYGTRFKAFAFSSFGETIITDVTHEEVRTTLLLTYKTIRADCKDLIWRHNTLVLSPEELICFDGIHIDNLRGVRHVAIS